MADTDAHEERRLSHTLTVVGLSLLWNAIRLPALAALLVLEPLVQSVLSGIAMLGILMTLFFRFVVHLPGFPFWTMLALSVGFAMLLFPYYLLIRLFSLRP